jgi:hypothetical protein
LKVDKRRKNIGLLFEKIYPSKLAIIIDKAYIIIMTSNRGGSRTPYIRKKLTEEGQWIHWWTQNMEAGDS